MSHFRKNCELNEALLKSCLVDSETLIRIYNFRSGDLQKVVT